MILTLINTFSPEHNASWIMLLIFLIVVLFSIFRRRNYEEKSETGIKQDETSSNKKSEQEKESNHDAPDSNVFPGLSWAENQKQQQGWVRGELEFHHQPEEYKMRANPDENITLGRLLAILDISKEEIGDMYVVSNFLKMQGQLVQDIEQVWNFDLCTAILDLDKENGTNSTKYAEHVILNIWYKRNKNESEMDECFRLDKHKGTNDLIIVHLRDSGVHTNGTMDKENYYICATVCIPPFSYTKQKMAVTDYDRLQGYIVSITFAYDKRSSEQKLAEYHYIQDDAIDKIKTNRTDELSDIQRYFLDNVRENIGKDFYFGKKAEKEKNYGTAIEYFMNIYEHLNSAWLKQKLSDDEKYCFFESCYCLGFCFCELGLYEKALYYLDIVWYIDNIYYKIEYINCLVNKNDFRALQTVSSEIKRISEIRQYANELLDDYEYYNQFLLRRIVYLYIEVGNLDEAETMLKDMLEKKHYENDEDFILRELAYIQKIRNQQE